MKLYHFKHFSKVFRISSILSINTTYSLHKYLSNKDKCISTPLISIKFLYNFTRRARTYLSYSLDYNNLLCLIFSLFPAFQCLVYITDNLMYKCNLATTFFLVVTQMVDSLIKKFLIRVLFRVLGMYNLIINQMLIFTLNLFSNKVQPYSKIFSLTCLFYLQFFLKSLKLEKSSSFTSSRYPPFIIPVSSRRTTSLSR